MMENLDPTSQPQQPSTPHTIFATLRDVLASLYSTNEDASVAADDAGLNTSQIAFSNRAQTNWHNILAEAIRQDRLDALLQVVRTNYRNNSALQTAYEQYRQFMEQGGHLEPPQQIDGVFHIGSWSIPKPILWLLIIGLVIVVTFAGLLRSDVRNIYNFVTAPTPVPTATPLPFATQTVSETLIVVATFHNTAATNSEAHTKIRRAIVAEAANHNEQLRVEVEPTILTADQRTEAEALGNRYNASMVIWGEDTGVEVIVNFLNLREPDFAAAAATITEQERTQLANPSAYARFITQDLPQTMGFLAFFAVGQSYYLDEQYELAIERIEAAVELASSDTTVEGLPEAYFRLGWLYQVPTPANLNQAIEDYNEAIRLDPNYEVAYSNRGNARKAQGDLDGAIDDYTAAIRLNPDLAIAYNNRGNARSDQGDLDGGIDDYTEAIRLNPDLAIAYNNRGLARSDQGDLNGAIEDYNAAIRINPDYAIAYITRGNARSDQGDLDGAIDDYTKAILLNPDDEEAHYNRGIARSDQGDLDGAIDDYTEAIRLNPDYATPYNNRGGARYGQGDLDGAIVDYTETIRLNPDFEEAYYNRGVARYGQGDLAGAIDDYTEAIRLNPDDPTTYFNRGNAFARQGNLEKAIADYAQTIHLAPKFEDAYYFRGFAYETQGKLELAIADYGQVIELDPIDAINYYTRGDAYYKQGRFEEAIADYDQATELDTNYAIAYNRLCWTYSLLRKPALALPNCHRAIEIEPNVNYYDNRGIAHALLGDFSDAVDDFQVVVEFLTVLNDPAVNGYLEKRQGWIVDLQAGKNPFTPEVLEELQHE